MFDTTPKIPLSPTQKKYYIAVRSVVFLLFIIFSLILAQNILFPTQLFNFDRSIDSLANTISDPYESKDGTSFHVSTYGESNQVTISLTLPKESPILPDHTIALIKKSYLAFLSSIGTEKYTDHIVTTYSNEDNYYIKKNDETYPFISKNAFDSYIFKNNTADITQDILDATTKKDEYVGFAPATLISSKEGVFVTAGATKHPIQDERTFHVLGYDFDNVITTNSAERAQHKDAKMFTITSMHPPGTIFYADDTDHAYIFDHDVLNKIPTTSIAKKHAIIIEEASRTAAASCILKKTMIPRHYTCTTSIKNISDFKGNTYHITLKDAPNTQIEKMQIKLFTTINKKALAQRVDALKRKLTTNYN